MANHIELAKFLFCFVQFWNRVNRTSPRRAPNYPGCEAPSLGFGSGSSCSCRTCQRMRARMRCASWVRVRILWASCYVINTQPRGFGSRFARLQDFMSFGCFICAFSPRLIQYTHTSLLLISKCSPESRWLSMVSLNTLNSWNSSCLHRLSGSSRFQVWLRKIVEQLTAISMNKESSL